jgi:serine/threonine protein kinase
VSLPSPHVVKYYGSYFKNTDLWIVMEYCGAGSVSDIIRLRNKTVSFLPEEAIEPLLLCRLLFSGLLFMCFWCMSRENSQIPAFTGLFVLLYSYLLNVTVLKLLQSSDFSHALFIYCLILVWIFLLPRMFTD